MEYILQRWHSKAYSVVVVAQIR